MVHRSKAEDPLEIVLLNSDNRLLLSCWGDALIPAIDAEFDERKPHALNSIKHQFKGQKSDAEVEDIYTNGIPEPSPPEYWERRPRYLRVQTDANTRKAVQDMVDIIYKCVNGHGNALSWFATRMINSLFAGFMRSAYNSQGNLVASRERDEHGNSFGIEHWVSSVMSYTDFERGFVGKLEQIGKQHLTELQVLQLSVWASEVLTVLKVNTRSQVLERKNTLIGGNGQPWINLWLPVLDRLREFLKDSSNCTATPSPSDVRIGPGAAIADRNAAMLALDEAENLLASAIVSGDTASYTKMAATLAGSWTATKTLSRKASIAFKEDVNVLGAAAQEIEHPWRPSNYVQL